MAELVRMIRNEPAYPGGPVAADVHPDSVYEYGANGWRVEADTAPPAIASVDIDDDTIAAFQAMESDPLAWTDAGLPKTGYLSKALDRPVSAAERDAWWAAYQRIASNGADT